MLTDLKPVDYCVFAGAGLMALGTFLPIVHMPLFGSINYIANGRGDGIIVLVLAAAIGGLTVMGYRKLALVAAILALAVMSTTIIKMTSVFHDMNTQMATLKDNPFGAGIAQLAGMSFGYGFGWVPLFGGALLVIGATLAEWQGAFPLVAVRSTTDAVGSDEPRQFNPDEVIARYLQREKRSAPEVQAEPGATRFGKRPATPR